MKKLVISICCLFCLALSSAAAEVYVVDLQKVLNESSAGKSAKSQLESEFKGSKEKLDSKRKELVNLQEDVKKQSSVMSEQALEKKIGVLRKKEKEVARAMQDYQEEFTRENNDKIGKIMTHIENILEDIAKEKNYPIILEKNERIVLFASNKIDISGEVIERLNNKSIKF